MWKLVPAVVIAFGLAACSSEPRVVASDAFQVSVAFDGSESGLAKANEVAREKCSRGARAPVRTNVARVDDGYVAYYSCRLGS